MITNIEVLYKDPSKSRWSCSRVMITDDKGNRFQGHWTNANLKKEELRLQLIKAGADPKVLEDFGDACYQEGSLDESDAHAGEAL